jgi:hypothetical protein
MQHKWMVVFTALVLFSLMIAPVGSVQAQVAIQEGNSDCPPYEPDLLQEEELLRSLPLECIKTYEEFAREANPVELEMGVPSGFVTVFQDEIDGAMSFLTASTSGTTIHKVTAENYLGFSPAVARLTNGNYLYAWHKFYPDPSKPWRNIEYTLLNPSGTVILPITKLVDNSGATLRTDDSTPSIAIAPDGTVGIVWSRYLRNTATNQRNYNIFFTTLNEAGIQITGPTNITNNTVWGTSSDYNIPQLTEPTIAATSDNRFIISWSDSKEVADLTYEDNVWYAVRNTAGANVLAPTALTTDNKSQDPILNSLTDGKVIILWGNYEIYNSVLHYAVINSSGTISKPGDPVEFGSMNYAVVWPQSYDAVLLPNGKVALAWVNGSGIEFCILNSSYSLESGPHIGNDDTPGGGISVTTNASSHVIITWVADHYSKLFYALGDSSGAFLTDPMVYHTNGQYINVNWHGQGSAPYEADDVEPDTTPPTVTSILRANANHTSATSVDFTVTFSEAVLDVDVNDFALSVTGSITGASIGSVTGSGSTCTVTVNTGTGNGTLGLTVPVGATITDLAGNSIGDLPFTSGETYTILKTATFSDVADSYWAWSFIERLVNAGITSGCGGGSYCPESNVTRAQMAVFLERGMRGASYSPPAVGNSTGFGDVRTDHWAGAWIKQLAADSITSGCGSGNYCPESPVTRAQMAVFLLKAKHGASYAPPDAGNSTGFGDVQPGYWAAAWIKQLVVEGITAGCGSGNYCPENPVTRAQMAVFLVRTFNLP